MNAPLDMTKIRTHNTAQVLKTPYASGNRARQSCGFFTPIGFAPMAGGAANTTPVRREYARRLASVLSPWPPSQKGRFSKYARSNAMSHRPTVDTLDDVQLRLHCLQQHLTCLSIAFLSTDFAPANHVVGSTLHGCAMFVGDISDRLCKGEVHRG